MRTVRLISLLVLFVLMINCSNFSTAGGGSDLPNGKRNVTLIGKLYTSDGSNALKQQTVYLNKIMITPRGDSIITEVTAMIDDESCYRFECNQTGRYILYTQNKEINEAGILQFIDISDLNLTYEHSLRMSRQVDLLGWILLPNGYYYSTMKIFIPGTRISTTPLFDGSFELKNVPRGTYQVVFAYGSIINYLTVNVDELSTDSDIFLRPVEFSMMDIMAQEAESYHQSSYIECEYNVLPKIFAKDKIPDIFNIFSFDMVTYFNLVEEEKKEVWDPYAIYDEPDFDTLLVGKIYRDSRDSVMLETSYGNTVTLSGEEILSSVSEYPELVTVAIVIVESAERQTYYVVELFYMEP